MKERYGILIVLFMISIIGLSVLVYNNTTPAALQERPEYVPNNWDTISGFLETWAPIFVPIITLAGIIVAIWLGLYTLGQTRAIEEKDRKERFWAQITQWASELSAFTVTILNSHFEMRNMQQNTPQHMSAITKLSTEYEVVRTKGLAVIDIAVVEFKGPVAEQVTKTFGLLRTRCDKVLANITAGKPALSEGDILEIQKELRSDDIEILKTIKEVWSRENFFLNRYINEVAAEASFILFLRTKAGA